MGMCLFSRRYSFSFISACGLLKRHIFVDSTFRKLYRRASSSSSVQLLDDFDAVSSSDSVEFFVPNNRLHNCKGLELVSVVVRVLKSLNWRVARNERFREAVDKFGIDCSINSFKMIVHIFAFARMHDEVHALLRDVINYHQEVKFDLFELLPIFLDLASDIETSVFLVDVLIKVYASNSLVENALDVFNQAKTIGLQPGSRSCNFLLKKLAELNKRDHLLDLFKKLKSSGPFPTVYTYTIMIDFYCKIHDEKDLEQATVMYNEMQDSGISPSVVTNATYIHGLCRVGCPEFAWDAIQYLKRDGQPLNSYCYNPIIYGFFRKCKLSEVLTIFEEMKSYGILPDVYSYSILIDGFCESGHISKGCSLFEEMKSSGIEPSIVTYTSLLKGLFKGGLVKVALEKIIELQSCGYQYDQHVYGVLIRGFANQGYVDYAFELLKEMMRDSLTPNASCYESLIYGSCKDGSIDNALLMFNTMKETGILPSIYSYSIVINGLCKAGKPAKALELIPPMLKTNVMPNVVIYSMLIYAFAKQSDFRKALMLYAGMRKHGVAPDLIASTIYINILLSRGRVHEAYNLFRKMEQKGLNPNKVTYTSIIDGFCKIKDMRKAGDLLREMVLKGHLPSVVTYSVLIQGFLRQGLKDKAYELFHVMRNTQIAPDGVILRTLNLDVTKDG